MKQDNSITTDTKKILSSGQIIQFNNEDIIIKTKPITVQLHFSQKANTEPTEELQLNEDQSQALITLINYVSDTNIGFEGPKKLINYKNKPIYINIRVQTLALQLLGPINRSVFYTIYQEL
jgi:hypothetical protein